MFHMYGFDSFGVDICEADIEIARHRYSHIRDHVAVINPHPKEMDVFFNGQFNVIIAVQSLYYLSNSYFEVRLRSLHSSLTKGGVFYAVMIGTQSEYYFSNSEEAGDGLRRVRLKNSRTEVHCFINFVANETELARKFHMFKARHTGFYSEKFRSDEGVGFHYLFVEVKE